MAPRSRSLLELTNRVFDVLVIGGGITGAGVARDAAMRGMSVALIDKGDFASGTSSRSSRLIHGGVRYLEYGHFRLVFEASAERRRLLRAASELVQPLRFTWPVYAGQRLPMWKLGAGLTLYDMLALFRNVGRHRRLDAGAALAAEPALRSEGLLGGLHYFDAATDDARLTLANVLDAERHGAVVANHAAFVGLSDGPGGRVARVEDTLTGQRLEIHAQIRVNATGPWADAVRMMETGATRPSVQGSKGVHLSVPRDRIGNRGAVTLLHPRDGRVMFALPSGGHTIIGTTDTFTDAQPDDVRASEQDVEYLLDAANHFFPDAGLVRDDVIAAWAGVRPLMPTTGSSVAASREHRIERINDRCVAITGGKLTTYRVMAAQVVDLVRRMLNMPRKPSPTARRAILTVAPPQHGGAIVPGLPYGRAALPWYALHEHAATIGDVLVRRTRIAFETRDHGRDAARSVAAALAPLLDWDASRVERELVRYGAETERIFAVDPA